MAKLSKLTRLFSAIASHDWKTAHDIATTIASDEKNLGHQKAAQTLLGAINPNKVKQMNNINDTVQTANILNTALTRCEVLYNFDQIMLSPSRKKILDEIIKEWQYRDHIKAAGLVRRSKLLFYGPPGCGKSMTAKALGHLLNLPTYVVRFDAVIGAYLGQTAIHLREIFRFAEQIPCVIIFDEVDALGKKRGNALDVGELDRIVISMMQELEHCNAEGLFISTTNFHTNLDSAIWRRFDVALDFPKPTKASLQKYTQKICKQYNLRPTQALKNKISTKSSFAEAEKVIQDMVRQKILHGVE